MSFLRQRAHSLRQAIKQRLRQWTKPNNHTLPPNAVLEITRSKSEVVLENTLLCQQLIILQRQTKRPKFTWRDRALFVFLASKLRTWKEALIIVQPDTVLRWHRELFKRFWKRKSEPISVAKNPTDQWTAQQLREATPYGEGPRFLIRDNDYKFESAFERVTAEIEMLKTPYRAPRADVSKIGAICERFLGSLRRECLDHFLTLGERHLYRVVKEYMAYFNYARPHQGIEQHIPCQPERPEAPSASGKVASRPVLRGLHHNYFWQAAESVGQGTRQPSDYLH